MIFSRYYPFSADREVAAGIQWSQYLDLLFVNNYESDSSLSWQYYGATSGFLRRFPGTVFPTRIIDFFLQFVSSHRGFSPP